MPDSAVQTRLNSQVAALTTGTNLFTGPERKADPDNAMPHKAVFCLRTGGRAPQEYIGQTVSTFRYSWVQVVIRGDVDDWSTGQTLTDDCWDALQGAGPSEMSGYVACVIRQSQPAFWGFDDNEHPRWSFTAELWHGGT